MSDKTSRRREMTAAEFMKQLENDPDYQARRAAARAEIAEAWRLYQIAEQPVREELRALGFDIDSLSQLSTRYKDGDAALPVLMRHLEEGDYPPKVLGEIAASMRMKAAVAYWDRLKRLYLTTEDEEVRAGLANALMDVATRGQLNDLVDLLDSDTGPTRTFFFKPILRMDRELGLALCEKYKDHPCLGPEATSQLKRRMRRKKPNPK